MTDPFIQLMRSVLTTELIGRPNEWLLLSLIAVRAKWRDCFSLDGLKAGEARVGDHESCGLTRQQYRTALKNLEKDGFIEVVKSTKGGTNRGTVVKLIDSQVFNLNLPTANHQDNHNSTNSQPSSNHQSTISSNKKEIKKEGKKKIFPPESTEFKLSKLLYTLISKRNPDHRKPDFQKWAVHVDRMIRLDKRKPEMIRKVIEWCQADDFWKTNVLSTGKLREKFDQLQGKMMGDTSNRQSGKLETAKFILKNDGKDDCIDFCKHWNLDFEDVRKALR